MIRWTSTVAAALAAATVLVSAGCGGGSAATVARTPETAAAPVVAPRVLATAGHDPASFTQGLVWSRGRLFESSGLYGRSQVRELNPRTGRAVRARRLGAAYFGEGLALVRGRLVQLTWRENTGFVWDRDTFAPRRTFRYRGEGWGLATDGGRVVMSDGTAVLRFLDPATFRQTGRLRVTDGGRPVPALNELEMVDGYLWANVFQTEQIVVVDLRTGRVRARLDMSHLVDRLPVGRPVDVLNGIAYDAARDRVLVTGKLWPRMFWVAVPGAARD